MLARLRFPALVGSNDETDDRYRTDAGEHVTDEALVPRHVDEGDVPPGRQRRPCESQIDGQSAAVFLFPAVGFDAGEGVDEGALAVVDVPGGPNDVHVSG